MAETLSGGGWTCGPGALICGAVADSLGATLAGTSRRLMPATIQEDEAVPRLNQDPFRYLPPPFLNHPIEAPSAPTPLIRDRNCQSPQRITDLIEALIRLDYKGAQCRQVTGFDKFARGHIAQPSSRLVGVIYEQSLQV